MCSEQAQKIVLTEKQQNELQALISKRSSQRWTPKIGQQVKVPFPMILSFRIEELTWLIHVVIIALNSKPK